MTPVDPPNPPPVEKQLLPPLTETPTFDVLIDSTRILLSKSPSVSVYLPLTEVGLAISKARRKRRPRTGYKVERVGEKGRG